MAVPGRDLLEKIDRELQCPQCRYSLRGLPGLALRCPECGLRIDRAALVTSRWTKNWFEAPGFSRLLWPVAWVAITPWLIGLVYAWEISLGGRGGVTLILVVAAVAAWLRLLVGARRQFPDGRGLWLSFMAHGLFAGYAGGLLIAIWAVVKAFEFRTASVTLPFLAVSVLSVAVLAWCRRGERYIAGHCIRQALIEKSRLAPPGS